MLQHNNSYVVVLLYVLRILKSKKISDGGLLQNEG